MYRVDVVELIKEKVIESHFNIKKDDHKKGEK